LRLVALAVRVRSADSRRRLGLPLTPSGYTTTRTPSHPSGGDPFVAEKLTLRQASRRARLSRRQLAFLIRTGVVDANLEDGTLYIAESELRRYRDEPP